MSVMSIHGGDPMTLIDSTRLLEERSARLSAAIRVLEELERAAAMVPITDVEAWAQPLVTAMVEARMVLEHEGIREAVTTKEYAREALCAREAWCLMASGHVGGCSRAVRPAVVEDFGPEAAKRRRY